MTTREKLVHMGNIEPHIPVTENGEVVRHEPANVGPQITTSDFAIDLVEPLIEHAETIIKEVEERGLANLVGYIGGLQHLNEWETAVKYVYAIVSAHAARGMSWIASEDEKLEHVLSVLLDAEHAPKGTSAALKLAHLEGDAEKWAEVTAGIEGPTALKTKEGTKLINNNAFGPTQVERAKWVAISANAAAPAEGDTTLAGEITTAGGGLVRKEVTWTETSQTVCTFTVVFTANGSDALPVKIKKFGLFNKVTSGGQIALEDEFTEAQLSLSGDNITITETVTTAAG